MTQSIGPSLPTIGRIVHVVTRNFGIVPALVTSVQNDGTISACLFPPGVLNPEGAEEILHDEDGLLAGTWHWPVITR